MKILGYGLCGPGEADRFLDITLKQFRICDTVVILLNNATNKEEEKIKSYGYNTVVDNREWGRYQWLIKQDFVRHIAETHNPDWFLALDMDERLDTTLTRDTLEDIFRGIHNSYHTLIIDLWDDGYVPEMSFWKVQMWRHVREFGYEFNKKSLHCGLVPKWAMETGAYAPHAVIHYGLKDIEERHRRVERYAKYDPDAKLLGAAYYRSLSSDVEATPFNEKRVVSEIKKEVNRYKQSKVKKKIMTQDNEFVFMRRMKDGKVMDIPKRHLQDHLNRGFVLLEEKPTTKTQHEIVEREEVEKEEKNLTCNICGRECKSAPGLQSHMRSHT